LVADTIVPVAALWSAIAAEIIDYVATSLASRAEALIFYVTCLTTVVSPSDDKIPVR